MEGAHHASDVVETGMHPCSGAVLVGTRQRFIIVKLVVLCTVEIYGEALSPQGVHPSFAPPPLSSQTPPLSPPTPLPLAPNKKNVCTGCHDSCAEVDWEIIYNAQDIIYIQQSSLHGLLSKS